ncbi:MAG: endonuclease III [Candidatus Marinimicrobia bacterium]|nr:endonuclease III [Candidatus Neomarinimicrobiota bacterium]|tara:strand:- start:17718 stop:18362 length:645 start_codon:yes stop_codon:yes gene_type:complete
MNRIEKSKKIGKILDDLYPDTPIPLNHFSAYTLLVAVMLSAQTTDKKVNEVTPLLFDYADTPEKMFSLKESLIRSLIKEIGLAPTKARNLKKMAKQLIEGGGVKPNWNYLENLAGVGHKTASVVMSQWYGIPAFPIDTHIHRLAARWGLSKAKNVTMTEKDLKRIWSKELWNKRHLQIIFFGREYCPARNHNLENCLICSWASSKKRIKQEMST